MPYELSIPVDNSLRVGRDNIYSNILSCASKAGSPTNRLGSNKTRGQGSKLGNHLDKILK